MSSQLNSPYEFEHIDSLVKGPLQGCINNFSYNWCFLEHFSSFLKTFFSLDSCQPLVGSPLGGWLILGMPGEFLSDAIELFFRGRGWESRQNGFDSLWHKLFNHQEEEGIWASVWHLTLSPKWLLKSGLGPGQSKDWEVKWQGHSGTQWCTGGPAFFFSPRM